MNIEAYNLDSLRTLVRKLQKENETLKRKLLDADIPYEDSNVFSNISDNEYYGAAEPPVRCGVSHLSGLTEPPVYSYSA